MLGILSEIGFAETILSEHRHVQNALFVLFMLCFIILGGVMSRNPAMIEAMFRSLFRKSETESADTGISRGKLLLVFQSVILFTIAVFCSARQELNVDISLLMAGKMAGIIGAAIALYVIYKVVTTMIVGNVFFTKEQTQLWKNTFFSMLSVCGIFLFVPVLLMSFVDKLFAFGFYFAIICSIFFSILLIYKAFVIFFQQIRTLLYFILYLCAQEIIPLYFLYKGISEGINYLFIF